VGLHSGARVDMRILPASAGTGVVFRRVDLDGFEVEAVSRNVAKVSYATSLMKKGVFISTTEHLLSAFIGMGVDNAIVELDNLELPILDGSAQPFVDMVLSAGLRKQRRKRTYLKILRDIEVREGDKFIAVYPDDGYSVAYSIDFKHPLIGKEQFQVELMARSESGHPEMDGDFYKRDIAPARTFGFLHEADAMRKMGLIRGASEENAIVLTHEAVKNGPLRFADEFVRHKVLDLIGDLALLGHRILGRVVADRAGHAMHTALVSRILKDHTLWEETTLEVPALGQSPASHAVLNV
jgi:UDP-3-O-[3-hydroxymyristoyl] N-acetylglucosamine deacetylase